MLANDRLPRHANVQPDHAPVQAEASAGPYEQLEINLIENGFIEINLKENAKENFKILS